MLNKNYNLYSFDIFDTLLTRKVARPTGIFVLMQHILNKDILYKNFPEDVKSNFYNYRTDAEFYLRRINNAWHNERDITFDAIYSYMGETYNLDFEKITQLKSLEIKLELETVVPIHENIDKVKKLIAQNKKVVLISDMYLPFDVIKQMLYNADPILADLKLYLSSKEGYMKKSGELFKYVKTKEDIDYKNWLHVGDNPRADNSKPKKLGINTILYEYVKFEDYERKILSSKFHSPIVQLIVGCSKNLRLNNFNKNDKAALGASLAGPILYPYVSWLLKRCENRSIRRLYFIARDGYILKEIADIIISKRNLNIKTSYIYGSRKAWRLSGLNIENSSLYAQFIDSLKYNRKNMYTIFSLNKKEFEKILPKELKKFHRLKNKEKIQKYFLENKEAVAEILKRNKQQKINAINYLKNNIDYSDDNFAFVDLDGSCLTQNCLASLFLNFYDKPIKSFYYAVTPLCYESINLKKYYFSAFKKPLMGNLIELLTRAPHGQTIGYDDNGKPVLEEFDKSLLNNWKFDDYKKGILQSTFYLNEISNQYNFLSFESQEVMNFYLNYLFESPDKKTADLLGGISHKLFGSDNNEFAPELNIIDALKYLFTKRTKSENIKFSKARSHYLIRKIIEYKIEHPNLRKQLINIDINKNKRKANIILLGIKISFRSLIWRK